MNLIQHPNGILVISGAVIVQGDDGLFIAACASDTIAVRIGTLLDRHGLADVPDDARAMTPRWRDRWIAAGYRWLGRWDGGL